MLNHCYKGGFGMDRDVIIPRPGNKSIQACVIISDNQYQLIVADGCNALDLFVLYTGFLWCVPAGAKRMLLFAVAGIAGIFSLNMVRLYILTILAINHSPLLHFAHHYAFTLVVYSCIFGGWMLYTKKYEPKKAF